MCEVGQTSGDANPQGPFWHTRQPWLRMKSLFRFRGGSFRKARPTCCVPGSWAAPPWASRPSPRLVLGFEDAGIRLQKGILEGEGGAGPLQKAVASLLNDKFAHQQILQFGRAFRE